MNLIRLFALALALGGALFASGCGSSRGPAIRHEALVPFSEGDHKLVSAAQYSPYRIQRGDLLGVFFISEELNEFMKQPEVLVLPDGSASFVGVDRVEVAGRTVTYLDSLLTARYSEKLRVVDLSVTVVKSVGTQVYVLGEVREAGLYNVPQQGFTVLGAITLAGGFQEGADKGSVSLIRLTPEGYLCREIDLSSVRKGRFFDAALVDVRPYDIIFVSRTAIGDFVAFSRDVVRSLGDYTNIIMDARAIESGAVIYGR